MRLLLQCAHVGDYRGDVSVRQVLKGLHLGLVVFLDTFLDGLGGCGVGEGFLHGGVGQILAAELGAHLGVAFAFDSVAFGAVVGVDCGSVSSADGRGDDHNRHGDEEADDHVQGACLFHVFVVLLRLTNSVRFISCGAWLQVKGVDRLWAGCFLEFLLDQNINLWPAEFRTIGQLVKMFELVIESLGWQVQ